MPAPHPVEVSARTVLKVCLTVLAVAALVEFLLHTQLALFLTLGAVMLAVAVNHAVDALVRRRIKRGLAGLAVGGGVALIQNDGNWGRDLAVGAGVGLLIGGIFGAVDAASMSDRAGPMRNFNPLGGRF